MADKQEISRLCTAMQEREKEFLSREKVPDEWKPLQDELHPYKNQIGDLYEAAKGTVFQIQAFASSLHVPLTLCAVDFPQTEVHRRALGQLGLIQHYGQYVSWDSGYEALTGARHLLGEIHKLVSHGSISIVPFPTPDGSSWEDIEIRFLSDHRVQITIKDVIEYRNYAEMGLEDGRNHKPNKRWECLRTLALEGSIRCPNRLKDRLRWQPWP